MVTRVTVLEPHQVVEFDEDMLDALARDLGPQVAENLVCRALEDMALRLGTVRDAYSRGHAHDLRKAARGLIAVSEQIALLSVARIARDVIDCLDRNDAVSLGATVFRLIRTGEMAVACSVKGQNLSV